MKAHTTFFKFLLQINLEEKLKEAQLEFDDEDKIEIKYTTKKT